MNGAPSVRPFRPTPDGVRLALRVTPRAGRDEIGPVLVAGDAAVIAARVRSAPNGGAANDALVRLVAAWLGVSRSQVRLVAGPRSRLKTVAVAGDGEALAARVAALLEAPAP